MMDNNFIWFSQQQCQATVLNITTGNSSGLMNSKHVDGGVKIALNEFFLFDIHTSEKCVWHFHVDFEISLFVSFNPFKIMS